MKPFQTGKFLPGVSALAASALVVFQGRFTVQAAAPRITEIRTEAAGLLISAEVPAGLEGRLLIEGSPDGLEGWRPRDAVVIGAAATQAVFRLPQQADMEMFRIRVDQGGVLAITVGPTLTPAPAAPLACVMDLSTSEPARIIVEVSDGIESWRRDFFKYATTHSVPLYGFKPGRNHSIRVSVEDRAGTQTAVGESINWSTAPLPDNFPPIEVLVSNPARMEPGFTLFLPNPVAGVYGRNHIAVNNSGEVIWYSPRPVNAAPRILANGNVLLTSVTGIHEMDLLGREINSWQLPSEAHHDSVATKHGTIITLRYGYKTVADYPSSETDSNAPPAIAEIKYDIITEFSRANGMIINEWHLTDIIDPVRIGYGSLLAVGTTSGGVPIRDWSHSNSLAYDPADDSIIVSVRHQDATVKFSRSNGQLIWILGNHDNWSPQFAPYLFQPTGIPFEWQYHQHAARYTPAGTLLLFDNGNYRASPFSAAVQDGQNFSRAVEYELDIVSKQVRQVWQYGGSTAEKLFSPSLSDADWLPLRRNVLITYGSLRFVNGVGGPANARVIEVTHTDPAEKVFEVAIRDSRDVTSKVPITVYRSDRIFDFYAKGDLDMDGDVDRDDLVVLLRARNKPALSPLDPRDLDRDGRITALDARMLTTLFYAGGPTE